MASFDKDPTVLTIKNRMKRLGIDLERYVGQITNSWHTTPMGFGFTCKDRAAFTALMSALVQSQKFGSDSMLGGSQHQGASFREVSTPDSLHIVLSLRPAPNASNVSAAVTPTGSIHLDSVSVVTGREAQSGRVIYDSGKVLQHLATDLLHTPLIMPSSEAGIVFGFRF